MDRELMRQIILDHYERPRNKIDADSFESTNFDLSSYKFVGRKDSPSCIDNIDAYLKIDNGIILDVKFSGVSCAIACSSTDIMSLLLTNKSVEDAKIIICNYYKMIKGEEYDSSLLESLVVYQNVKNQANRIKCALTGIEAIELGIKDYETK